MSEKISPVRKLIKSIESLLDAYADNLNSIAKGEEIKYVIEDKTIDTAIKFIKEMTNLEQFEKIANPTITKEEEKTTGNTFEDVSKKIQAKLNGKG